jgi:glycosyltransferase involved in cell wall biosynthesis
VKEITLFARGNARDVTTWSGLPKGCADALEAGGLRVNRIDISPHRLWLRLTQTALALAEHLHLPFLQSAAAFFSHWVDSTWAKSRIRSGVAAHPSSECNLLMTYSFTSRGISSLPVVNYCDQTFKERLARERRPRPRWGEAPRLKEEEAALQAADLIVSTNAHCIDALNSAYSLRRVFPRPVYGINLQGCTDGPLPVLSSKRMNGPVVFVGTSVVNRGLDILLEAFRLYTTAAPRRRTLHIVGFEAAEAPGSWEGTVWHGRLDKADDTQAAVFWNLLRDAGMFVIPSRVGPLPGVILEAQYFATPVITTPVWNAEQFVEDGVSGLLVDSPDAESLSSVMTRLDQDAGLWDRLAEGARQNALRWTWESAAEVLLAELETVAALPATGSRASS